MSEYLHGAYGQIQTAGTKVAQNSRSAIVYVGTAPVHQTEGGANNVNKPLLVNNLAEARKLFGYSDVWSDYTLCEAMKAHLDLNGVGPLILINVLDPKKHKETKGGTTSATPVSGRIVIADAEKVILDSVVVKAGTATKAKGVDYGISYDVKRKVITIAELTKGALGTEALTVTWDIIKPDAVVAADVIGSTDGAGLNTGLYAIRNVYQQTGFVPSLLLAPGFSSIPSVHEAMQENAVKVNGHWDVYLYCDIPIVNTEGAAVTLENAKEWKAQNGYNKPNETVYFPMAKGVDGKKYHISVLAAANMQLLLKEQDGIPYKTPSNTPCNIIENLYLGEDKQDRVYDDTMINESLNRNGIASAAYTGGRWAIWGCHSAEYTFESGDQINVSETNRMMLYYLSNDFQHRRPVDVDKPLTRNDIMTIVSEEQTRLDALVKIGALIYGKVEMVAEEISGTDVMLGHTVLQFNVTTTPLTRSLKAIVNWTRDGFVTYYADSNE